MVTTSPHKQMLDDCRAKRLELLSALEPLVGLLPKGVGEHAHALAKIRPGLDALVARAERAEAENAKLRARVSVKLEDADGVSWAQVEAWAVAAGWHRSVRLPWTTMSESTDAILFYGYTWEDHDDVFAESEHDEAQEAFGVKVFYHCSSDARIPAVAAKRIVAHRGYPVTLEPPMLDVDPAWARQLDGWFEQTGIEKPADQPMWILASWWA